MEAPSSSDQHAMPSTSQHLQRDRFFMPIINPAMQTPAHVMPEPSPWRMDEMPWKITEQPGGVVQFTANQTDAMKRLFLHQKRKSDLHAATTLPTKQFISEEKITAHFNGLHISSDYIQHDAAGDRPTSSNSATSGKCFTNLTYEDYQITAKELEEKLRNAQRITMCEELRKFNEHQKKATYIPEALFNRTEKPCTALVLWQPPPIVSLLKNQQQTPTQPHENDNNALNHDGQQYQHSHHRGESIADDLDTICNVALPPESEDIDDYIDNNNSCSLDFNNIDRPDCMEEDM